MFQQLYSSSTLPISDIKIPVDDNTDGVIDWFEGDPRTSQDYYAFGMLMPERQYVLNNDEYRYGFNGMEQDNEIKGNGNSLDFGARIYDSRLGRWMSLDALQADYPDLSPYSFVANSPIFSIDPDGKKILVTIADGTTVEYVPGVAPTNKDPFLQKVHAAITYNMETKVGEEIWGKLGKGTDRELTITEVDLVEGSQPPPDINSTNKFVPADGYESEDNAIGTILWDPNSPIGVGEGEQYNEVNGYLAPSTALIHEAGHALRAKEDPVRYGQDGTTETYDQYDDYEELRNVINVEQVYLSQINAFEKDKSTSTTYKYQPIRYSHRGAIYFWLDNVGVNETSTTRLKSSPEPEPEEKIGDSDLDE